MTEPTTPRQAYLAHVADCPICKQRIEVLCGEGYRLFKLAIAAATALEYRA